MALAVISLMQTLEQLLHPKHRDLRISKYVETLQKELCSLRDLLQDSCTTYDGLETMIINVAFKAEDVIGSNLLDDQNQVGDGAERFGDTIKNLISEINLDEEGVLRIPEEDVLKNLIDEINQYEGGAVLRFPEDVLKNLIDEVHSVVKEVKKLKKKGKKVVGIDQGRTELSSQKNLPYRDSFPTTVVGLGDDFRMITDQLTNSKDLQVVSIVGMGGIGKTTLAKSVYRDTSVVEHFDRCAWVTVSQEFQERDVYLGILRCFGSQSDELDKKSSDEVAEQVYKGLKGRRYLIVLDDVWNTTIWDQLRRLFPNDGKGSRIVLTTRNGEVALYASSGKPPHQMRFLSIEQGWELLSGKVCCHPKFEEIGKQIVFKCGGLPLAILVVAGLLSKVNKTVEDWKNVLENLNALVSTNADEDCFGILGLSYNQLSFHLKSCFVYTALFPEDAVIPVSKLIKLWMAEGFVEEVEGTSLEEVAEAYLEELIDRSLVLICKRGSNGKAKTCMVHDLLRELCLREANTQKFLQLVTHNCNTTLLADTKFHTRFIFQSWKWEDLEKILEDAALNKSRSILILGMSYGLPWSVEPNFVHFKLLRVLDVFSVSFSSGFLGDLKYLIYLRYLAVSVADTDSTFFIEDFHCLQTLVVRNRYPTPTNLIRPTSRMERLRHMELGSGEISGPIFGRDKNKVLFPNLQTLSGLCPSRCGRKLFRHIINLKRLGISYCDDNQGQPNCLASVRILKSLIALKFQYMGNIPYGKAVSQKLNLPNLFPLNLKKLTLLKSFIPWEDMTILARGLPNLEILKLKKHAFMGPEWATNDEDSFLQLKVLVLESLDLVHWKVSSDHFPRLRRLIVRHCYHLEGIPLEIGDISTLQEIELDRSNPSVVGSAQDILEEQHNWGNDEFRVHFNSSLRICK